MVFLKNRLRSDWDMAILAISPNLSGEIWLDLKHVIFVPSLSFKNIKKHFFWKMKTKKKFGKFSWKFFIFFIYEKTLFFRFLNDKLGIKNYMFQVSQSFTWQVGRCHMVIWKQGVQVQKFLFMKIFEKKFDQQIGETNSNRYAKDLGIQV